MFKFIKNLFGFSSQEQETVKDILTPQAPYKVEPPNEVVIARAKDAKGKFVADDPSTPDVNEAWKGGKAPARKPKPAVTEGKTKGGPGAVKKPKANNKKPKGPSRPKSK